MADRRGYTSLYQNIPVQPLAGYSDPSAFIRVREAVRGLEDQVNQIRGTVGNSVPGYVSSVGLTAPTIFSVSGSPVTDTGTIALSLVSQTARSVFAAPTGASGTPTFRALEAADIQSGTFGIARGGTGLSTTPTNGQLLIGNGTGYTLANLSAGSGISVTNGSGSITIANTLPGFLNPMTTLGDLIYGGVSGAATRLAGDTTDARVFLRSLSIAGVASAPVWDTVTKTDVGLSLVENTALSTWAGTSNITTLGTVTTGTWSATSIAPAKGGTGLTSAPAQDVIVYGGGSLSFSTLAPPSTGTKVLTWTSGIGITWTDKPVGTVTSVGLSAPTQFSVTNSPVTGSGTLTLAWVNQNKNIVFAGPATDPAAAPTFRSLVAADIPDLDAAKITTGTFGTARGGTGLSTIGTANQVLGVNSGATGLEYKSVSAGTGISVTHAANSITITNTSPSSGGTVTLVTGTAPISVANGTTTPAISLGTVGVANGGTGLTSYTTGDILYASGTTTLASLGLTTGGILYGGASAPAWTATADLAWDQTNKRLGIGTSSPVSILHAYESSTRTGVDAGLTIEQAGTGDAIVQFLLTGARRWVAGADNSDGDKFKIASTFDLNTDARLTITTDGAVGLGTTSPQVRLHVDGTAATLDTDLHNNTDTILAVQNGGTGVRLVSSTTDATNTGNVPALIWITSKGTVDAATAVASGDYLGRILVQGIATGGGRAVAAEMRAAVDAAPGAAYVPGRFEFWTTNSSGTQAERMRLDSSGNLGIGLTPSYRLDAAQTDTSTAGAALLFRSALTRNPGSASSTIAEAVDGQLILSGGANNMTGRQSVAGFTASHTGTGTITRVDGLTIGAFSKTTAGTITTLHGMRVESPAVSTGTVTTAYGLYLDSQDTGASVGTGYGVYSAGTTDLNTFAGKMRIGSTTDPTNALDVTGSATVSANLTVDTDTFFVDSTNNAVAVGTVTVTKKFNVFQAQNAETASLTYNTDAGSSAKASWLLYTNAYAGLEMSSSAGGGGLKLYNPNAGGLLFESVSLVRQRIPGVKSVTDASATGVVTLTLSAASFAGCTIIYTIEATDGTNHQSKSGIVHVAAARNTAGTASTPQVSDTVTATSTTSGTLTSTWTAAYASGLVTVSLNADTSLTASAGYPRVRYTIFNNGSEGIAIL